VSDPLSRSTAFSYDSAGRTITGTFADGRQVHYGYDGKGNLTSLTPPGRPAHVYDYTSVDNVEDYKPPASSDGLTPTHHVYNLDRQLTQITRPDAGLLQFGYDSAGRLQTTTHPSGQISYGYSATTGNLTAITTAGSTLGVSYDGSLVTGLTWSGAVGGSVGFGYNNNFRVTSLNVNGTNSLSLTYDRDGLLVGAGNLTISRNSSTGIVDSTRLGSVTTVDHLDNLAEWTRRTAQFGGTTMFDASYVRDTLGRLTQITETVSGGTTVRAFAYDSAGRLAEVRNNGVLSSTYEYDSNGNRERAVAPGGTKVGTYDDQDRMIAYGSATYRYTRNGELSTKAVGSDTTRYNYDALGNLRAVTLPDGSLIEYIVDGMNRRIGRKVNGVLLRGWLYQGQLNPIAELDGQGNVVTRFVYATRSNVPDYFIRNGTTYRIITDHLGSVRLVVDATTGAVAEQIDYDEWGNVTSDTNAGLQPFGYAGGLYDGATGLVRFGARDYDASTGRWTAKDPITFGGGSLGLYSYVDSDPINLADPVGLCPQTDSDDIGKKAEIECRNQVLKLTGAVVLDLTGAAELGLAGRGALDLFRAWRFSATFAYRVPSQIIRNNQRDLMTGLAGFATAYFTGSGKGIGFGYTAEAAGGMHHNLWGYVPLPGFATGAGIYDVYKACWNPGS
jgi:RHS repeat-associated protein